MFFQVILTRYLRHYAARFGFHHDKDIDVLSGKWFDIENSTNRTSDCIVGDLAITNHLIEQLKNLFHFWQDTAASAFSKASRRGGADLAGFEAV